MAISLKRPESSRFGANTQSFAVKTEPAPKRSTLFCFRTTIKPEEVLFFTSQLSLMLEIGTSLNQALKTLKNQTSNTAFKKIIGEMIEDIEEGRQLSYAMERHSSVFNHVFTSMVKAGETGGFLKEILDRLVELQERRRELMTQLRSSLTYPVVLSVVAILVTIFVVFFVLPKFAPFFSGKESLLPFTTRLLLSLNASVKAYWWAYVLFAGAIVAMVKLFRRSTKGQALIDRFCLSGPIVGKVSNKIHTCQLLRILGTLMQSHVPLLDALKVTRSTIGNLYFREFIDRIVEHVKKGGKFCEPFADYRYALDSVKQMIATGEEAGNLPKVMVRLAKFYDAEVGRELKNVASLVEPLALIFMAGVVGIIVSSVILPLFRLASTVQ